ncbi:MAG: BACON domain-containing protein [Synergistes sp.]|nr:BACON domain-containing protein [Synergistes sp.]
MSNNKAIAVLVSVMLMTALLFSGGCNGSGNDNSSNIAVTIGEIDSDDIALFGETNVELVPYTSESILKHRSVILCGMESLTDEQTTEIGEMFKQDGDATISLYEPTSQDVKGLKRMIGADLAIISEDSLIKDEDTKLRFYSVCRDERGNIHSYAEIQHGVNSKYQLVRNDQIRSEDVEAGYVWVKYDKTNSADVPYDVVSYELTFVSSDIEDDYCAIAKEILIGSIGEDAISINTDSPDITVQVGSTDYKALSVEKKDTAYFLARRGTELPDDANTTVVVTEIPVTDEEKRDAGELTDNEKEVQANKTDVENFAKWLCTDKSSNYINDTKTKVSHVNGADSQSPELFEVARQSIGTVGSTFLNLPGLSVSVTTSIVGAHHFEDTNNTNGGYDYYYVKQTCVMTNNITDKRHWYQSGTYNPVKLLKAFGKNEWYWIGGAHCDEFYISDYNIKAELPDHFKQDEVNCIKAQPEAYNKSTSTTVSHGWDIGGSVNAGVEAGEKGMAAKAGLALNFGYHSNKSKTYTTSDIECKLFNEHRKITWQYFTTKKPHRGSPWWKLTYPADLAVSTYQPAQYYIWRIPTSARSRYKDMTNTLSVTVEGAYSRNSGSRRERHASGTVSTSGAIALPKPPLFCLDKSTINFDEKTAKTAYVTIYSQGYWNWDTATVPNWLTVKYTESNSQFTIEADENDTGRMRTAEIKLQRGDGSQPWDKRIITVTQSKYSK